MAIVTGFFLPIVIAVINQPHWSKEFKTLLHFVACMFVTALQLSVEGRFDRHNFFPTMLLVLAGSVTMFQGILKPSGLADVIEKATSPRSPSKPATNESGETL